MKNLVQRFTYGPVIATAIIPVGCGGSGSGSSTGLVTLGVSDGPIHDAENACITFNEIS